MILIAAAIGVICTFLPWISVFGYSVSGMHGWGVFVFLCFLVAGAIAFMGDQTTNLNRTNWMAIIIVGGIASLIMVINFLQSLDALSLLGIGFYGALIASLAIVGLTFVNRSATDTLQSGFDSLKGEMNRRMNTTHNNSTANTTTTTTTISHSPTDETNRPTV